MRVEILNGFWLVSYNGKAVHSEIYGLRSFEYYKTKLEELRARYEKANVQL